MIENKIEYFAAHAPVEVPSWFKENNPVKIPDPPSVNDSRIATEKDRSYIRMWLDNDPCELPNHLSWFADEYREYNKLRAEAQRKHEEHRFFSWRWYYAAIMADYNYRT